ncbi:mixed lineage kinase domain-like protein isoform X2 [Amphiura filiformis]|uniref:mixed lineage kinase domain-like protein isoform X1 n=1 Tax=Amphiura filiformis TaxID=82378 RepID=UPI003B21047E
MDIVGMAQDIVGLAQTIYDAVQEVKEFKTRSRRLSDRIQCLNPALEVLVEMKDERQKIIALQKQDPPVRLPVFSKALVELKQVVQNAMDFIMKLQKMDTGAKLWKRKNITGQFNTFSERLDVLQNTVQFGVLVEMRGLMQRLLGEEQKMSETMKDMKKRLEGSKKEFRNRQDVDLDDDAQDTKALLAAVSSIQEGQERTSAGIERIEQKLEKLTLIVQQGPEKASSSGFRIEDVQIIKYHELSIKKEIGKGTMGIVYKAVYNKHKVAVKKLQPDIRADLVEVKKQLRKEAEHLKKFDSKNVVRLWGLCAEKDVGTDSTTLMIIMEFMDRGTLKDALQKLHKKEGTDNINWGRRVHMALGGALGLYRIHSMQPPMLHCAIDSTKLMVDKNFEVKISDVGFAHTRSSSGREHVKRAISYYAPEHLDNPNQRYDERSEMYGYGVVMWEIVSCLEPYAELKSDDEKMQYLMEKKEVEKVPSVKGLPKEFKSVINKCRKIDRDLRLLSGELVDVLQRIEESLEESDSDDSDSD